MQKIIQFRVFELIYLIIVLLIFVSSCSHPEHLDFERNKNLGQGDNSTKNGTTTEGILSEPNFDSQSTLSMEVENGVRYVWIQINGINLRFIFDTGASSICISPAEATVLYRQGTLSKEDILDVEYFQDATGRISEGTKINLREVKVGDKILTNVHATVVDNVNAPLLLGQSVLERFGTIEIDNTNMLLKFK